MSYKADVGLITESHNHSLKKDKRFSEYKVLESVPIGGKHSSTVITNDGTFKMLKEVTDINVTAKYIANDNGEEFWVIAAYFPNAKEVAWPL